MTNTPIGTFGRCVAPLLLAGALACLPLPPPGVVLVDRGPPAMRHEVVVVSPGPGFVWIYGYWSWGRNEYHWVPGRWLRPDRGFREWEPGRWVHSRRGWYWREGRWR
jgi:hypothetical protein